MLRGGASGSGTKPEAKKGNARAFVLNTKQAAEIPDAIIGTFLVNNVYARVLFDSSANQSFINHNFCSLLNEPLTKLDKTLNVETANGDLVGIYEVLEYGKILLEEYVIHVQLLPTTLVGFDIVLDMDWLSDNQVRIVCDRKTIELRATDGRIIQIAGDKNVSQVSIISMIKANNCQNQGCLAFMAYVTEESKKKEINGILVVAEFPNVFPKEQPGIPPNLEVVFKIDLKPCNIHHFSNPKT
ncbi:uncharacterized protein LOC143547660 [Bidens hawaiensis]|uniref:uncharacterized protein LOC143547660 n=1 Tax=Bidens hawaiensis TaxID=980011 RepID=UPI00404A1B12